MAYATNVVQWTKTTSGSITGTLPTHASGDLICVFVSNDVGTSALATSTTGWAFLGTQASSQFTRCAMCYKVAASSSETAPTITGTTSDMIATVIVFKDVAASPFGASPASGTDWVRVDWGNSTNISYADSGSLTSATAGCLLVYFMNTDGGNVKLRYKLNEAIGLDTYGSDNTCQIIGMVQQESASAAPTVRGYATSQFEGGNYWTFAIRNASGGSKAPMLRAATNEINWYGDFGALHQSVSWQTPDNFAASIGGINTGTSGLTTATGNSNSLTPWGTLTELRSTLSTASAWAGGTHTISSTDMTGLVFGIQWQLNTGQSYTRTGANGVIVCFSDGTNWVAYQVWNTSKPYVVGTADTAFIALGNATAFASSGSINWAAVTRIGYFWQRIGSDATQDSLAIKNAVLMGTNKITGGGSSYPSNWSTIVSQFAGMGAYKLAELQGSGQVLGKCSLQIGDGGTNQTYWDSSAKSLEYPPAWSSTLTNPWQMSWNAGSSAVTVGIYAGSSDTINLTAGIVASTVSQLFTVNASSSTSATYNTAGTSIIGFTPTMKTGVNFNSTTFKQCGVIDLKGSDPTSLIMNTGTGTAICSMSDGGSLTGTALTASSTAIYGIRIAAAGQINLDSTTFSGFTKDLDVTATTGTVTVVCAAGQTTPTYQTAGATVDIQSDQVYQEVTIDGATAGSRIQIYDTTSSTELYNGTPTFPYTWTDGSPAVASRAIRLRVAYQSGVTAKNFIDVNIGTCGTTSTDNAISYLVNQEDDYTYNLNAINGSTVTGITITAGPNRVSFNIGGGSVTNASIYAYQVYWQATSTGIANETAFISSSDPANYIYTDFLWKNTNSSVPLSITGGWARDSVTGLTETLFDTTGYPVFAAANASLLVTTGSGPLTSGQEAQLATAASSSTAAANQTANLTFNGTAVEADITKVLGTAIQTGSNSTASIGY